MRATVGLWLGSALGLAVVLGPAVAEASVAVGKGAEVAEPVVVVAALALVSNLGWSGLRAQRMPMVRPAAKMTRAAKRIPRVLRSAGV